MIIFGIDPGVSGAISVLENKKVIEVYEMPTMIDGKKNKISLDLEKTKSVLDFLETLEDDDDIQHVYANLEIVNNFEEKNLT